MKYYGYILFTFLFLPYIATGQNAGNFKNIIINYNADTLRIDTLSIIPGSFVVKDKSGNIIDSNLYHIDYFRSALYLKPVLKNTGTKFQVTYKVYPYNFSKEFKHKNLDDLKVKGVNNEDLFIYEYKKKEDIFEFGGLSKSGSISRGISFGNTQDVIVNSSLNMQLSGRLNNEVDILAAITDNNIPIQPEGNTQQIQDFDKVFIQLSKDNSKLIAGDFELSRPKSYFMNFYKKAQGGSFTTSFKLPEKNDKSKSAVMRVSTSAAISKGKYARNTIAGIEGIQGPYKLTGANNESYIIVLSGTEKVYIDGMLMVRGQENDYVIDYNTAEITFTPKNMITKDKRIIVEYEYSEKNYARSLLFAATEYEKDKLNLRFSFYSEQDMKNQPVQQELTDEEKHLLEGIGDSLNLALALNVDSVDYTSSEVLYKMIDTTVNTVYYDSVFVYSDTNDANAFYRVGFLYVGEGKGNYIHISSLANGKVFQWIAPQSGVCQGNYEPVRLLVTPMKQQMYTLSADYKISKRSKVSTELALSNKDVNTFSSKNDGDNAGVAFKFGFENRMPLGKKDSSKWELISVLSHEWIDKRFNVIERYRSAEFERDWNITDNVLYDENISGVKLSLLNKNVGSIGYQFNSFFKGEKYKAVNNGLNADLLKNGFRLKFSGSLVNTNSLVNTTQFLRQQTTLSKTVKWFTVGVKDEQEYNVFREITTDTLQYNSFSFNEWQLFANNADTSANKFSVFYKKRIDNLPENNELKNATDAESMGFSLATLKNPNSRLNISCSYRKLTIKDSSLISQKADNSLVGRFEYYSRLLKGLFVSNTFYELGSGLEVKKEFSYVEVAAGQGVYSWTDYNNDGEKQLDEFEIAVFKDQADYIRIFVPTNEYVKTYMNQFSEMLDINPERILKGKKGIKKILSKFSNKSVLSINRKSDNPDLSEAYNPFYSSVNDSMLISLNSTFRNTFYFNRASSKFGMELNYQDSRNKTLFTYGFDSRTLISKGCGMRWNITRKYMLKFSYDYGDKTSSSEYMTSRDYDINYYEVEPALSFQPNTKFRVSMMYNYKEKQNNNAVDTSFQVNAIAQNIGAEVKCNKLANASLIFKLNYINIAYKNVSGANSNDNTSLAYEMLEGLKTGENITWNVSYQRNLSKNLQMNLMYEGRKSPGVNVVHLGSVQVRAYF